METPKRLSPPQIPSVLSRLKSKESECNQKVQALRAEIVYWEAQATAFRESRQMIEDEQKKVE